VGLHRRRPDRSILGCRPSARSWGRDWVCCPGSRAGHLADLFRAAGIGDIVDSAVAVDVEHATFEDWWEPFTLGVAPSGAHVAGLEPDRRTALRELCRERLPEPPFVVSAKAWVARGAA